MVHGIRVVISVAVLSFIRYGDCDTSEAKDSDEDSALKDALLLVDILKSAYVKVLKENGDLRAGSDTTAELSTCPTTMATNSTTSMGNVSTISVPLTQLTTPATALNFDSDKHLYNWSPPPFYRSNPRNYRRYPPRYYRRFMNMPLDYYYYDSDKYRRFNYEDAFGAHPNETAPNDVVTQKETISTAVTTVTTHEAKINTPTMTSILLKSKGVSSQTKSISITKPKNFTQSSGEQNKKLKLMLPVPSGDISTADPVISQVASELINEFGSGRPGYRPKHLNIIKLSNKNGKPGVKEGWWHLNPLKTTLRIHLSRSTKFPIPYPDNHAFCYTNPGNALCRTLIK